MDWSRANKPLLGIYADESETHKTRMNSMLSKSLLLCDETT